MIQFGVLTPPVGPLLLVWCPLVDTEMSERRRRPRGSKQFSTFYTRYVCGNGNDTPPPLAMLLRVVIAGMTD